MYILKRLSFESLFYYLITYISYKKVFEQLLDECPICGKEKYENLKFCSHKCAATNNRKVDWDSIDLIELMKNNTISELEDLLGVSNAAIYKRRDKILGKK